MRFLIVSDNVGAPHNPRGIFHYTTNLIRALRQCGHDVCLLVEHAPRYALPGRVRDRLAALSGAADDRARLGTIYNYLWRAEQIGHHARKRDLKWLAARLLHWPADAAPIFSTRGLRLSLRRRVALPFSVVANRPEQLDFVPTHLDHLRSCSEIALCDSVYSLSFAASFLGVSPPTIDAQGFDVILVDTPSYFRFERSPGSEVVAVVHDLIPLVSATHSHTWRRIFVTRLVETLEQTDSLIFVSEFTRSRFHEAFPSVALSGSAILHPSVADDIADDVPTREDIATEGAEGRKYFVAIMADEPRKNIRALVDAWAFLPDEVGLKLIGDIDPERYGLAGAIGDGTRVEAVGYVDEATKRRLIAGSVGLVMPSLSEGFGIPLVEAFMFAKPVFCSDIAVFREVAGENGIYFDGYSAKAIAAAIGGYLQRPDAYADRVRAGQEACRRRFTVSTLRERVAARFGAGATAPFVEAQ